MLGDIGRLVQDLMGSLGWTDLAPLLVPENLFPPSPSEVVLPLAGFFVGRGYFTFWGALLASTIGSTLGALVFYGLGRRGGRSLVLRHGGCPRVGKEDLDRAEGWFA